MVLGLIPDCDLAEVTSVGNAAGTGALHGAAQPQAPRRDRAGGQADREDRDRGRAEVPGALHRRHGAASQTAPYPHLAKAVNLPCPRSRSRNLKAMDGGRRRVSPPPPTAAKGMSFQRVLTRPPSPSRGVGVWRGQFLTPSLGKLPAAHDPLSTIRAVSASMSIGLFCKAKCPYCDFNSHVRERIEEQDWRESYLQELAHYAALTPDRTVTSIFFGGGTPSLMDPQTAEMVIDAVARHWRVANDIEITLEANPTSVEAGKLTGFRAGRCQSRVDGHPGARLRRSQIPRAPA